MMERVVGWGCYDDDLTTGWKHTYIALMIPNDYT